MSRGKREPRIVAELAQPHRHHRCAHAVAIGEDHARALHADPLVGGLDQLAAGSMHRAGQAAGSDFLFRASIEQDGAARSIRKLAIGLRSIDRRHGESFHQLHRLRAQRREVGRWRRITPVCAALQLQP